MLNIRILLILVLLMGLQPTLAREEEPKVYQTGTLIDLQVNSQQQTSYIANANSSTQSNFYRSNTNTFASLSPITSVKNTYFFFIKLKDLTYVTSFSPKWKSEIDTNWIIGKSINVRINDKKNRVYIQKPSGKELKTKVLRIES